MAVILVLCMTVEGDMELFRSQCGDNESKVWEAAVISPQNLTSAWISFTKHSLVKTVLKVRIWNSFKNKPWTIDCVIAVEDNIATTDSAV